MVKTREGTSVRVRAWLSRTSLFVDHVALLLSAILKRAQVGGSQEQRPGRERAGSGGSGLRDWDLSQELRAWAMRSNSRPDRVSPESFQAWGGGC